MKDCDDVSGLYLETTLRAMEEDDTSVNALALSGQHVIILPV